MVAVADPLYNDALNVPSVPGSEASGGRIGLALRGFLAGLATLLASFANFLIHQDYPIQRVEAAAVAGILGLFCLAMAAIYCCLSLRLRLTMEAALVMLLVDINFSGSGVVFAVTLAVLAALLIVKRSLAEPLAVFGAIVLAVTLAGAGAAPNWMRTVRDGTAPAAPITAEDSRPAIVHVLLDEHQGLAGFPDDAAGRAISSELRDFYTGHGFRVYPRAFSRHMHTINAVPDVLNFGEGNGPKASDMTGVEVGETRYFQRLAKFGYTVSIYQSDFAEFCGGMQEARCIEYDSASLSPIADYPFTTGERIQLTLAKFLSLSQTLGLLERLYGHYFIQAVEAGQTPPAPPSFTSKTSAVATLRFMDRLERDLAATRHGQAVFVHALFPHYPYVTEADCRLKPLSQWRHRRDWTPQTVRQSAYYDQVRCAEKVIGRLIAALDRSPVAKNYVMIVHGDHGSRITGKEPLAESKAITRADMLASFSTLFAVKLPGKAGGTDDVIAPTSALLRAFALNDYQGIPVTTSASSPTVILDDRNWRPTQKWPLPVDW